MIFSKAELIETLKYEPATLPVDCWSVTQQVIVELRDYGNGSDSLHAVSHFRNGFVIVPFALNYLGLPVHGRIGCSTLCLLSSFTSIAPIRRPGHSNCAIAAALLLPVATQSESATDPLLAGLVREFLGSAASG